MAIVPRGWASFSLVIACFGIGPAQAALVVDDFGVGAVSLTTNGPQLSDGQQQTQSGLDPARVLGGQRFVSVGVVSSQDSQTPVASSTPATVVIQPGSAAGEFAFDTAEGPPTNVNNYFTLRYGSAEQPLALNLTDFGDRFLLRNVRSTGTGGRIDIAINFAATNTSATLLLPASGTATDVFVPFSSFGSSANLATVNQLYIHTARADEGWTLSFDDVLVVPEPAGLGLVAGAFALLRRRSRHASA